MPGVVHDVVSEKRESIGAPHVLTDGEWVWTEEVLHYIATYHIEIPPEFLERMRAHDWQCPPVEFGAGFVVEGWGRIGPEPS